MKNIYDLAELYDQQYTYYREDLHFYTALAHDYGSPVLELGAGTARVSVALAKAGHKVTAIEFSQAMLERGLERLQQEGLSEKINLQQGDMRTLELAQTFPLIIAPFNTLMHAYTLGDQDATLATVKKHLRSDGVFAFDLYNPNFRELNVLKREAEWNHIGEGNTELFIYQSQDADNQILESRYYLDTIENNGNVVRQTAVLRQRYYTHFELERMLYQAGFKHIQIYGGFDKRRYSSSASHMVVVAK
jgi:SAM-dependent methyltransferase